MKAHEIFQNLPAESVTDLFTALYQNDKPAYRACLQILSTRRKLRPVVIERKTLEERQVWMRNELSRKSNEDAATEVLQTWLLGGHRPLVIDFLDLLSIPHDGQGLVETLPPEPPAASLTSAIDTLLTKHPQGAVAAYLNLFVEMDIAEWPELEKILQNDSRLCLAPQTQAA